MSENPETQQNSQQNITLSARNKLRFADGELPKPASSSSMEKSVVEKVVGECSCGAKSGCTCGILQKCVEVDNRMILIQFLSGVNASASASDSDHAVHVSRKPHLIMSCRPSPDADPCKITIFLTQKHEIRQGYVRSTARVYEIYYRADEKGDNQYLCTVRCDVAVRMEDLMQETDGVESWMTSCNSSNSSCEGHIKSGIGGSSTEDGWMEVKVQNSCILIAGENKDEGCTERANQVRCQLMNWIISNLFKAMKFEDMIVKFSSGEDSSLMSDARYLGGGEEEDEGGEEDGGEGGDEPMVPAEQIQDEIEIQPPNIGDEVPELVPIFVKFNPQMVQHEFLVNMERNLCYGCQNFFEVFGHVDIALQDVAHPQMPPVEDRFYECEVRLSPRQIELQFFPLPLTFQDAIDRLGRVVVFRDSEFPV